MSLFTNKIGVLSFISVAFASLVPCAEGLEFEDGDRIAFIGARQLEGQIEQGYLETILTARMPDRQLHFRNFAWAGDEVDRRTRPNPFPSLWEWVDRVDPDIAVIAYGQMEAFRGKAGIAGFIDAYSKLLQRFEDREIELLLLSPTPHEVGKAAKHEPAIDPEAHNRKLKRYTSAIAELANRRGHELVDLFNPLLTEAMDRKGPKLTSNGLYLTPWGYWRMAQEIAKGLGIAASSWEVTVNASDELAEATGTKIEEIGLEADPLRLRFTVQDRLLPPPPRPETKKTDDVRAYPARQVEVNGLSEGDYLLREDGEPVARASAKEWAAGVRLNRDVAFDDVEALREAIIEKNRQWFYRYRPQNHVHVYGERQQPHLKEEVSAFKEVVERYEEKIARKTEPLSHTYELMPDPEPQPELREIERVTLRRGTPPPVQASNIPTATQVKESFDLADGFKVNLFADTEQLHGKPIQMRFDPQGRLWVSTTTRYPLIQPGSVASDRIIVLEDTSGDGRADRSRIFADHLLIPGGILPMDGGVYVHYDTRIVHLSDTDGDGRADRRRVIASGLGTEDTHHMAHSFRRSPWGNLYFNQGVFLHTTIETPAGIVQQAGQWDAAGLLEINPRTGRARHYLAQSRPPNPWGHYFNEWGWSFHIDSSGQDGSSLILPTAAKTSSAVAIPGGSGQLMDGELIGGSHLPESWRGDVLSNFLFGYYPGDTREGPAWRNRVRHWSMTDKGSGYAMEKQEPLISSDHSWFRPTQIKQGADGALYLSTFVTPIIDHAGPHQRDPRRDRRHGRIWRIRHQDRPLVDRPRLNEKSVEGLLESLASSEPWIRRYARQALAERSSSSVLPALRSWIDELSPSHPRYDHLRIQGLWTFKAHGIVEESLLNKTLHASNPKARAAATLMLRYWHDRINAAPLKLLRSQAVDEHPRVRLAAVIALSHLGTAEAMDAALAALNRPTDRFLEQALQGARQALAPAWHAAIKEGRFSLDRKPKQLQFLLAGQPPEEVALALNAKVTQIGQKQVEVAEAPDLPDQKAEGDAGQAKLRMGRKIFEATCMACHQADGKGLKGSFPPLAGSRWVFGKKSRFIRIALHGLAGPLEVKGKEYFGFMPAFDSLNNEQLAAVLTYVRKSWGNEAPEILDKEVEAVREATAPRTQAWTVEELTTK